MAKSEQEKRVLILLAVLELGGRATKRAVLDHIYSNEYADLTPRDLEKMASRDEEVWRNDLAYIRKHLVQFGYLDGSEKDNWQITPKGTQHFLKLVKKTSAFPLWTKLTKRALEAAANMESSLSKQRVAD
ncbi:MAG TPA: winged helix-turn-helix domain-containing protein [Gemmataceae bacterium]|nr:winged helix-turn-helix domain-containing protein [Gemmataceae bacterium]